MNAEIRFWMFLGFIIGALVVLATFVWSGVTMAGTDGYCAALGGESIKYGICNVDGRVVNVP